MNRGLSGISPGLSLPTFNTLVVALNSPESKLLDLGMPYVPELLAVILLGKAGVLA